MDKLLKTLLFCLIVSTFSQCDEKEVTPSAKTMDIIATSASTVSVQVYIVTGNISVKQYGFEYRFDNNPPVVVPMGTDVTSELLTKEISLGVFEDQSVFIKAYLIIKTDTLYGEEKQVNFPIATISGFSPTLAKSGDQITISGNNFSSDMKENNVWFNEVLTAKVVTATKDQLIVEIPESLSDFTNAYISGVAVSIKIGNQTAIASEKFKLLSQVTVGSFSPAQGSVGTLITISGSGFNVSCCPQYSIAVDGIEARLGTFSSTSLTFEIPYNVTHEKVKIVLMLEGNTFELPGEFTVTPLQITAISPQTGIGGTYVSVYYSNFPRSTTIDNFKIRIGGLDVVKPSTSGDRFSFYVPQGMMVGEYDISVTTSTHTIISPQKFKVVKPVITGFSPPFSVVGTLVNIWGQDFGSNYFKDTSVFFNEFPVESEVINARGLEGKLINVIIPDTMPTGDYTIKVNVGGQTITAPGLFKVTN